MRQPQDRRETLVLHVQIRKQTSDGCDSGSETQSGTLGSRLSPARSECLSPAFLGTGVQLGAVLPTARRSSARVARASGTFSSVRAPWERPGGGAWRGGWHGARGAPSRMFLSSTGSWKAEGRSRAGGRASV